MKNWDKILKDFSHKCDDEGVDMTNPNHIAWLRESIVKYEEDFRNNTYALNEFIGNLRNGKEVIVEKRKAGETWKTKSGWAGLKPGEDKARYGMDSEETAVAQVSGQEVGGEEESESSISEFEEDLKNEQQKTSEMRDKGEAGAGGEIASQGESRFCNAVDTLDEDKFKEENKESISERKSQFNR